MDISLDEEKMLPLPSNWLRVLKPDGSAVYKSSVTVVETEEHPYIVQALNAARKLALPEGWFIKETVSSNGGNDYYYCNPSLGLSMWDPPSLRQCLADCLNSANHKVAADRILSVGKIVQAKKSTQSHHPTSPTTKTDISLTYQQFRMQQQLLSNSAVLTPSKPAPVPQQKQQWINASHHAATTPEQEESPVAPSILSKDSIQSLKDRYLNKHRHRDEDANSDTYDALQLHLNENEPVLNEEPALAHRGSVTSGTSRDEVSQLDDLENAARDDQLGQYSDHQSMQQLSSQQPLQAPSQYMQAQPQSQAQYMQAQPQSQAQYMQAQYNPQQEVSPEAGGEEEAESEMESDLDSEESSELDSDSSVESYSSEQDINQMNYVQPLSVNTDSVSVHKKGKRGSFINDPESEIVHHMDEIKKTITPYFKTDKWGWSDLAIKRLSTEIAELEAAYAPVTYRVAKSKPPVTTSGIKLLVNDIVTTNERMQQLLLLLRSRLCSKNGIYCRTIYAKAKNMMQLAQQGNASPYHHTPSNPAIDYLKLAEHLCASAGEMVHVIREYPMYAVEAIYHYGEDHAKMSLVAYLLLHRLLHPFACDSSLTSALLLEGINYQMTEMGHIEQIFPDLDGKALMSRALFIRNPQVALCWNPLAQPLPLAPMVANDTTLGALLKCYAIRRDITAYFRLIWRPVFPSVLVLAAKGDKNREVGVKEGGGYHPEAVIGTCADTAIDSAIVLADTFAIATRILELTLKTSVISSFPPGATSVCRALYQIGGVEAVQIYILSFLLLPNLVKIFLYENDSLDNEEDIYYSSVRRSNGEDMDLNNSDVSLNKFYNLNIWWPSEGYTLHNYSLIHALLWHVWRVFTGACFLNNVTITVMTSEKFFGNGPPMSSANVPEQRLRNILFRLKKKINNAVQILIKLPLDLRSNEILGIVPFTMSPEATANAVEEGKIIHGVPAKYWIKRLESLVVKPSVMCQTVLFSRHEIGSMLSYIATAMEAKAASIKAAIDAGGAPPTPPPAGVPSTSASESPLYQAILDYLKVNNHFNKTKTPTSENEEDDEDELMIIPISGDDQLLVDEKKDKIFSRYFGESESSSQAASAAMGKNKRRQSTAGVAQINSDDMAVADRPTMLNQRQFRYDQLVKGLTLLNRYEDSVVSMLKKMERNGVCNIETLLLDDSWVGAADFDVDVNIEQFNTVVRHTSGSVQKMKSAHYGLRLTRAQNSMQLQEELSAEANITNTSGNQGTGTNYVSRSELDKNYFASLRFGTAAHAANAGTSLAAKMTSPPPPRRTKARDYSKMGLGGELFRGSTFDKSIENKQFLKRTNSFAMKKARPEMETRHDRESEFQKSLRDDVPRPWSATSRSGRSRTSSINTANSGQTWKPSALASVVPQRAAPAALPFPEHMRHRLRQPGSSDANYAYNSSEPMHTNEFEPYYPEGGGSNQHDYYEGGGFDENAHNEYQDGFDAAYGNDNQAYPYSDRHEDEAYYQEDAHNAVSHENEGQYAIDNESGDNASEYLVDEHGNYVENMDHPHSVVDGTGSVVDTDLLEEARSIISDFQSFRSGRNSRNSHVSGRRIPDEEHSRPAHYMAPTESLLKKLNSQRPVYDYAGAGYRLRDINAPHYNRSPQHSVDHTHRTHSSHKGSEGRVSPHVFRSQLDEYHHDSALVQPAFVPSGKKIVPSSGPRAPAPPPAFLGPRHIEEPQYGEYDRLYSEFENNTAGIYEDMETGESDVEQRRGRESKRGGSAGDRGRTTGRTNSTGSAGSRSGSRSRSNSRGRSARNAKNAAENHFNASDLHEKLVGKEKSANPNNPNDLPVRTGHYMELTESMKKKLTTKRTIYDNTGAGYRIRDINTDPTAPSQNDGYAVQHTYEFQPHEFPHPTGCSAAPHHVNLDSDSASKQQGMHQHSVTEPEGPCHYMEPTEAFQHKVEDSRVTPHPYEFSHHEFPHPIRHEQGFNDSNSFPTAFDAYRMEQVDGDEDYSESDDNVPKENPDMYSPASQSPPSHPGHSTAHEVGQLQDAQNEAKCDKPELKTEHNPVVEEEDEHDWNDYTRADSDMDSDDSEGDIEIEEVSSECASPRRSISNRAAFEPPKSAYDEDEREPPSSDGRKNRSSAKTIQRKHTWNKAKLSKLLLVGIEVIKHGRSGAPKVKLLKYIPETQRLHWQAPRKTGIMSVFGGVKNREDYVGDTFLSIPEICEVKKGMHTEVLLNSRSKDKTLNPLCFLSIIAKNRTLDLQCKTSKDRDVLYRSFQGILSGLSKSIKFS